MENEWVNQKIFKFYAYTIEEKMAWFFTFLTSIIQDVSHLSGLDFGQNKFVLGDTNLIKWFTGGEENRSGSVGRNNKNNNIGNRYGEQDFDKGIDMNWKFLQLVY